jgi:hypothetical protein
MTAKQDRGVVVAMQSRRAYGTNRRNSVQEPVLSTTGWPYTFDPSMEALELEVLTEEGEGGAETEGIAMPELERRLAVWIKPASPAWIKTGRRGGVEKRWSS